MTQQYKNVYQVLENTVERFAQRPAYYMEQGKQWCAVSWRDYKQMVDHFALALCRQGFQKGDTLAILAGNCLAWPVADLGTIAAGGIGVGMSFRRLSLYRRQPLDQAADGKDMEKNGAVGHKKRTFAT